MKATVVHSSKSVVAVSSGPVSEDIFIGEGESLQEAINKYSASHTPDATVLITKASHRKRRNKNAR